MNVHDNHLIASNLNITGILRLLAKLAAMPDRLRQAIRKEKNSLSPQEIAPCDRWRKAKHQGTNPHEKLQGQSTGRSPTWFGTR